MEAVIRNLLPDLVADALERVPADRAAFLQVACDGDKLLLAEVESLLAQGDSNPEFLEKPAFVWNGDEALSDGSGAPLLAPGASLDQYRIIRLLGSGGMGDVYLAEDTVLERRVALKFIRAGLEADYLRRRFQHERRVLAALTHPNIARLYGGDTTDDGLAFLALEYVEGERLDRYCDNHGLGVAARLKLFCKVCEAVAYAHQNLIIHRDLKPGNILVTAAGEPKLLDFGIAKLLEADAAALDEMTVTLTGALTPEYACPEQLRGEPITTASDVYSLGVVLYELLTGQRPHHLASHRLADYVRMVCEQEPERPSAAVAHSTRRVVAPELAPEKLSRHLQGDLDNIIAMALRKEPPRRYRSVAQFSDDLCRHLANLPVTARKDTLGYRVGKFVRRHQVGVATGALALAALLAALAAAVWQAHRAEVQRARADRRFDDVHRLADSLMGEIHDSVQTLAGATPTRKLIVTRALEYLDHLRADADSSELRRDLAAAYQKIGDVQGNPYESNLGDSAGALVSYRRAESLLCSLAAVPATNSFEVRLALGRVHRAVGDIFDVQGHYPEMDQLYRQSLDEIVRLGEERPADPLVLDEVARAWGTLAGGLERTAPGGPERGHALEQAMVVQRRLVSLAPDNVKYTRGLAVGLLNLGVTAVMYPAPGADGDRARGVANIQQSVDILHQLSEKNPVDVRMRRSYLVALFKLGWAQNEVGDTPAALVTRQRVLQMRRSIAESDPNDEQAQFDLFAAEVELAESLLAADQPDEALKHADAASSGLERLLAANPGNTFYRRNGALLFKRVGAAHAALARRDSLDADSQIAHWVAARAADDKARQILADLAAQGALRHEDIETPAELAKSITECDEHLAHFKH